MELDPETKRAKIRAANPAGVGLRAAGEQGEPASRAAPQHRGIQYHHRAASPMPRPQWGSVTSPRRGSRAARALARTTRPGGKRELHLRPRFDPRFFNVAHPDLVCRRYLEGESRWRSSTPRRRSVLRFRLPLCQLGATRGIAGRIERPALRLEAVVLEPNDRMKKWDLRRGAVRCDKRSSEDRLVRIGLGPGSISGARSG